MRTHGITLHELDATTSADQVATFVVTSRRNTMRIVLSFSSCWSYTHLTILISSEATAEILLHAMRSQAHDAYARSWVLVLQIDRVHRARKHRRACALAAPRQQRTGLSSSEGSAANDVHDMLIASMMICR